MLRQTPRASFVLALVALSVAVSALRAEPAPVPPRSVWQPGEIAVPSFAENYGASCDNCPCNGGCDSCNNRCYGLAEAIFWSRVTRTGDDQPVVILTQNSQGNYPGPTVLTTGDLATADAQPGLHLLLGKRTGCDSAIEFEYFGLWDLNSSAVVNGNDNLAVPGDLGLASLDFFAVDRMFVNYTSELHNFEVNFVHDYGCTDWQWLVGLRYLNLNEQFNIIPTDINTSTSVYHIGTQNNLFGGQIGARILRRYCHWGWDATGKVGIFGNAAEQNQYVSDFPPGFFLRSPRGDRSSQVAMVADMNLSGVYRLTDTWGIRAGYTAMWIEGVATAPGQLDFTDTPTSGSVVNSNGGMFLHGANIGLEARW